jgi:hypothetical protein
MAEWRNIEIYIQNIATQTDKAALINCPHKSAWDGFSFWHPLKLIRDGSHSYAAKLSYTDEWSFNLKRFNKNRAVIAEKTLNVKEFEEVFGVMNENISAPKIKNEFETHIPATIPDTGEVAADKSLLRKGGEE